MIKKAISPASDSRSAGDIAERAYAIYVDRGRTDGFDREDWLRAERELRTGPRGAARKSSTRSANPMKPREP